MDMEEVQDEIEEIPSSVRVLLNPELLLMIFGYVDTTNLLKLRRVCHKWRSVTKLSLQRRFKISSSKNTGRHWRGDRTQEITFTNSEKAKCIPKVPQDISKNILAVSPQPKHPKGPGRTIRRFPFSKMYVCLPASPIISLLLEQQWISQVTILDLESCLTVDEWNAVGCHIVSKFPSLSNLVVRLHQAKPGALPMCYHEILNQPLQDRTKFDKLTRLVFTIVLNEGKVELEEPTSICYDILNRCSKLEEFESRWNFSDEFSSAQEHSACAARIDPAQAGADGDWKCGMRLSRTSVAPLILKNFVQDVSRFLPMLQPLKNLKISMYMDLPNSIPPTCIEDVETLTLCYDSLDQVPITAIKTILRSIPSAFRNVRKMSIRCEHPRHTTSQLNFNFNNPEPAKTKYKNLIALQLIRELGMTCSEIRTPVLDAYTELCSLAPNVELLMTDYFKGERLEILELASKFSKLKHLVLFVRRRDSEALDYDGDDEDIEDDDVDLTAAELNCIKGLILTSLTLIIPNQRQLKKYTEVFVKACAGIESIKQLYVYSEDGLDDEDAEVIDLSTLGINIPLNLEVMTGSSHMLQGTFIDMEDTGLTWEQILFIEDF